jgi:hypothetical protein
LAPVSPPHLVFAVFPSEDTKQRIVQTRYFLDLGQSRKRSSSAEQFDFWIFSYVFDPVLLDGILRKDHYLPAQQNETN